MNRNINEHLDVMRPIKAPSLGRFDLPHPMPFTCEITVTKTQLSSVIEHVSNIEYVRWLDRAAELHADSLGYTRQWLLENDLMWFVARHEIDYLAEAWLGDRLIIATWVRDFGKVKSWRDYIIVRPADNTLMCRAATLWVLVELSSRKPRRIPNEMVDKFKPLRSAQGSSAHSIPNPLDVR